MATVEYAWPDESPNQYEQAALRAQDAKDQALMNQLVEMFSPLKRYCLPCPYKKPRRSSEFSLPTERLS